MGLVAVRVCRDEVGAEVRPFWVEIGGPGEEHVVWDGCGVACALVALVAAGAVTAGAVVKHRRTPAPAGAPGRGGGCHQDRGRMI